MVLLISWCAIQEQNFRATLQKCVPTMAYVSYPRMPELHGKMGRLNVQEKSGSTNSRKQSDTSLARTWRKSTLWEDSAVTPGTAISIDQGTPHIRGYLASHHDCQGPFCLMTTLTPCISMRTRTRITSKHRKCVLHQKEPGKSLAVAGSSKCSGQGIAYLNISMTARWCSCGVKGELVQANGLAQESSS